MSYLSNFLHDGYERGLILKGTGNGFLDEIFRKKSVVCYIGFDATASSLHVGHLLQIQIIKLLQETGHKPLVLLGGITTQVGDPSGTFMRKPLSLEEINKNIVSISRILSKYLVFGNRENEAIFVNNADWLSNINHINFLKDYGKYFSMNRLLSLKCVKSRMKRKTHMSFLELNYTMLQSYDFLVLHRLYNCLLQIGGGDQWGNITLGVNFVHRVTKKDVYGITSPLILTSEGKKMGKTLKGQETIWLDESLSSPFKFWQYWYNISDNKVGQFLRIFTNLPLEEIKRLEVLKGQEINVAKKILADRVTNFCHGKEFALCVSSLLDTSLSKVDSSDLLSLYPYFTLSRRNFKSPVFVIDLLCLSHLVRSKSEARRAIRGHGVKLNGLLVSDEKLVLNEDEFFMDGRLILSLGKKNNAVFRIIE